MNPQAQRPLSFFAMVTDKRNAQNAKVCHDGCLAGVGGSPDLIDLGLYLRSFCRWLRF